MDARTFSYGGDEHFNVALEYQTTELGSPPHQHALRTMQKFEIINKYEPEEWTVTVTNADSLTYKINIMDTTGSKPVNW